MKRTFDKQSIVFWGTLALALASIAAYVGILSIDLSGDVEHSVRIPTMLGWYALAMCAYIGLIWWQERLAAWSPWLVWGAAILFHVLLLLTEPALSSDVYRYLWDGHVANHGISPFAYAIDAPELDRLAVPVRAQANHTWMASPYMPSAQWLFAIVTSLLPLQARSMQLVMSTLGLCCGWFIWILLRRAGLPTRRVVVYLWNPLVVIELAQGAHVDAWMVLLLLAAIVAGWQASHRREFLGALLLGMAILTKVIPILVVPILGRGWRRSSWLVVFVVVAAALAWAAHAAGWGVVGPLDGTGVFGALRIYSDRWDFNSGIYRWLHIFLAERFLGQEVDRIAKILVTTMLAAIVAWTWWKAGRSDSLRDDLRLISLPLMGYILLTTTVHPWYLLPVLAFLPFWSPGSDEPRSQWLATAPWLYLSGAIVLSYLTYLDPANMRELRWVRQVEWIPTLGGLIVALLAVLLSKKRSSTVAATGT